MNFSDYQALALRTEAPLPTKQARLEHALLGLITEGGEFSTPVKRIAIYGKSLDSLDKDGIALRLHAAEEIGDALWYVAIASDALGRDLFASHDMLTALPGDDDGPPTLLQTSMALASATGTLVDVVMLDEADEHAFELLEGIMCILNCAAILISVPFEQIAADNIAKLQLRYPDKFTAEAAEARADKGGLDARNS